MLVKQELTNLNKQQYHMRSHHGQNAPKHPILVQCKICRRIIGVANGMISGTMHTWLILNQCNIQEPYQIQDANGLNHYDSHGRDESNNWFHKKAIWYGLRTEDL